MVRLSFRREALSLVTNRLLRSGSHRPSDKLGALGRLDLGTVAATAATWRTGEVGGDD